MISYSNRRPLTRDQIIEREQKIYQQQKIPAGTLPEAVQLENVRQRAALTFRDRPFNIFVLSSKGYPPIVGRKIISSSSAFTQENWPLVTGGRTSGRQRVAGRGSPQRG